MSHHHALCPKLCSRKDVEDVGQAVNKGQGTCVFGPTRTNLKPRLKVRTEHGIERRVEVGEGRRPHSVIQYEFIITIKKISVKYA